MLEAASLAGRAVVGPVPPGAGLGPGQVDPPQAAACGKVAVGLAQGDGFRGPQSGAVQTAVERLKVASAGALAADGGEQRAAWAGRASDHAAVDGFGDLRDLPLDAVDRVGNQQPLLDGVADRVVEH